MGMDFGYGKLENVIEKSGKRGNSELRSSGNHGSQFVTVLSCNHLMLYHFVEVPWMTDIHRENIAHMLASMHLVLRQQDGQERDSGEYRHVTNTAYEKFVERYGHSIILLHCDSC